VVETIVVTGAAGSVGRAVRPALRAVAGRVILVDRVPVPDLAPGERSRVLDIADVAGARAALAGADAVLHLAGVADEAPLADLVAGNVLGTHHVLEAARLDRVARVVLASSNRVTGGYPVTETVSPGDPPRPDGLYGASKVAVEALGRLYADKFGLSVVCLRIGTLAERPGEARDLATWLSPRDCGGFAAAALTAPGIGFATGYAVSANTRRFWTPDRSLGYHAVDDAERYAEGIAGADAFFAAGPQGGRYAAPEYTLPHL
jgi:uronate dehydrogenase